MKKKRLVIEIDEKDEKEIQRFKGKTYHYGFSVKQMLMKLIKNFNKEK